MANQSESKMRDLTWTCSYLFIFNSDYCTIWP